MEIAEYKKQYELEGKYWWWVGRRGLIIDQLTRSVQKPVNLLDIGCGTGSNLSSLENYGYAVGLDFSQHALSLCKNRGNGRVIQADAQKLPFHNQTFNVVTALDILEHVENDAQAAREIFRVLKPGGQLILTVPALPFLWSRHDEAMGHQRRYTRQQLIRLLNSNGLIVSRISYWNFLLFLPVMIMRQAKKLNRHGEPKSDPENLPNIINGFLLLLLRIENALFLCGINLPIGVSLICICHKPQKDKEK